MGNERAGGPALSPDELLDDTLVLTERMMDRGRAGEWLVVLELDGERNALLQRLHLPAAAGDGVLKRIIELRGKNDELLELARTALGETKADLRQLARQREASQAYTRT